MTDWTPTRAKGWKVLDAFSLRMGRRNESGGTNRRFDLTFGPSPLAAILYMGVACKPAFAVGDRPC